MFRPHVHVNEEINNTISKNVLLRKHNESKNRFLYSYFKDESVFQRYQKNQINPIMEEHYAGKRN